MQKIFLVVLLAVFLSACNVPPASTPSSPEKIVLKPRATSTNVPTPSSTITPTSSPRPTMDPNFFRDDFAGALMPQWRWTREDPRNWSLTALPGSLQINVVGGYVTGGTNSNLLLQPAPAGDFQIETLLTFRPVSNYQFAGLIIYASNSNFIQAGREYCKAADCVGAGLYMDYYQNGVKAATNFGQTYKDSDPILLRLSRRADGYTFDASTDGKVWFSLGTQTSDMKPSQVGLVTGQQVNGGPQPAVFDYFEMRSLP